MWNFDEELEAIKSNLYAFEYDFPSIEQLKLLGSLMSSVIEKPHIRKQRIEILRLFTADVMMENFGIDVTSSKCITKDIATFLINQLIEEGTWELSEYGKFLLDNAKTRIEIPA